ncbi:MAG: hypothetical protein L0Y50_05030 [Beijerinckiaceae bacterium]|nr:hypothetical protein [Beijerinckiaceae bacterium]MCI0735621.1 hypothetical protein [Beijerinckiaceae bacterium]
MRSVGLICLALITFTAVLASQKDEAQAAACARGVYRAGCVGPRGAVSVRRAPVCRWIWVNGVRVRRCS